MCPQGTVVGPLKECDESLENQYQDLGLNGKLRDLRVIAFVVLATDFPLVFFITY